MWLANRAKKQLRNLVLADRMLVAEEASSQPASHCQAAMNDKCKEQSQQEYKNTRIKKMNINMNSY